MKPVGAQMQARIPVADSAIGTELEVLFKPKNVLIILERVIEIAHLEHWTDPLRFHNQRMPGMPNGFGQEFQPERQGVTEQSRRDERTKPGVSTPGISENDIRPERAAELV
jgi:hypothetical protein